MRRLAVLLASAAVGGLLLGWVAGGFFWAVNALIAVLWQDLPAALGVPAGWYTLAMCTLGGLLVGLGQRFLGDHPAALAELLSAEDKSRGFDVRILPQAVYMLAVSLAFGGALGPELGLVFLCGTIGVAVARVLKREASTGGDIAIAAVFTTLFASPLGGAAAAVEPTGSGRLPRAERVAVALVAGLAAVAAFTMLPTPGLSVSADWPPHQPGRMGVDLLWAAPLGLLGVGVGLLYQAAHGACDRLSRRVPSRVVPPVVAGVLLGALGAWDSLVLFSGEDGIEELAGSIGAWPTAELLLLAVVKLVVIAALLGSGWKGGHFYPMLFVATATALGVAQIVPVSPVVAVAAVAAGVLAAILRRAVAAAFLVLLMVPPALLGVSAVAAAIGVLALRGLDQRRRSPAGADRRGSTRTDAD